MTHFGLSPDAIRPLCWALLHFLWQGLALALLLAAALAVVRRAAVRYALGVATMVLMVAAPVATFLVLRHPASRGGARNAWVEAAAVRPAAARASAHSSEPGAAQRSKSPALPAASDVWLLEFWLAGVVVLSVRAFGGFCLLERMRRRETSPVGAELEAMGRALERHLGLGRALRYCQCRHLDAPAVIGWLRPVVLLPVTALTGLAPEQLRAVMAHELAHIRRHDAFVNLFQTGAETLLFYHPAVWWVSARVRAERENCCDDVAVSVCGGIPEYARALMLMEEWRRAPRLAMAANRSPLHARVLRLLGLESRRTGARSMGFAAASLCLGLVLLAGTGLMGTARGFFDSNAGLVTPRARMARVGLDRAGGPLAFPATSAFHESLNRTVRTVRVARVVRAIESAHVASVLRTSLAEGEGESAPSAQTAATAGSGESAGQEAAEPQTAKESFISGLNSLGYKNLTADELIGLKVQGVTPEYIRQIRAAGLNPTIDELIGMKVQGVTPEYIRGLHADGLNPTVEEVIGMRVQRVTPEYIGAMRAAGLKPTVDELIGMKVQGVTPEYLSGMHAAGVDLTAEEAIGMKVQGVSPEYIRDLRAEGVEPKSDELIGMKVQGVTPEYVREMHAAGLKPAADDLIAMKVQGVTPEYIRDMHAAGLSPTADQLIALRTQGVSPDFVRALQAAGLGKLSANDYIAAKVMDITPEFVEKVKSHGIQGLTLDKLIGLKQAGVF
ncbi:MAG TPA: M56 family metallopeptidase [Terriglobia bacterium]|nr:M56 family metallopeptidase [Terriglobia bacterium]